MKNRKNMIKRKKLQKIYYQKKMIGSNSISKNQKRNKNSNASSNFHYTRSKKNKKLDTNTYDVYDIEQSTSKRKRKTIKIKNSKSNEKINNIDIIEDIEKIQTRFDNNNNEIDGSDKSILPPLSPISISSDNPDSIIEINDISSNENGIEINEDNNSPLEKTSDNDSIDSDDDDDEVEIINEKYVKYSSQPTIFEVFNKNKILWCHYCGTTNTSSWRHGPWGKKSLCNKHGCDYKGYGFTVRQPRLDLSKFAKETSKRVRPVIQEYCCICFSNRSNKQNALVMCNGCYRSYHQECHPDKISSDIVNSSEPYYCKEECKHTLEKKKIETDLPRKNLPFMFNRGISNSIHKGSKSLKMVSPNKPKILNKKSLNNEEISPTVTPVVTPVVTSPAVTPADSPEPNSPSTSSPLMTSPQRETQELIEPEPKVMKAELINGKSPLDLIKEQRLLHRKRNGLKEEDKIIHYTKNLPPIIGFKHDEIPLPSWEVHKENENNDSFNGRKRKDNKEEIVRIN